MVLAPRIKIYVLNNEILKKHPIFTSISLYIIDIVHLLAITMCTSYIINIIILPLLNKVLSILARLWDGILYMMGSGGRDPSNNKPDYNPSPNSNNDNKVLPSDSKDKDKKDKDKKDEGKKLGSYLKHFFRSKDEYVKEENKIKVNLYNIRDFTADNEVHLTPDDQKKFHKIVDNTPTGGFYLPSNPTAYDY
jgi:hypothetical protein